MPTPIITLQQIKKNDLAARSIELGQIRKLQIDQAHWNLGERDISTYIQSGLVYFYLITQASKEKEPEIIGSISLFSDGHFAMLGSFIIDASRRAHGIGQLVLLSLLNTHRIPAMALLSTPGREHFYERNDFHTVGFFSRLNCEVKKKHALSDLPPLSRITAFEMEKMLSFDEAYSGIKRKPLLRSLSEHPENITYTSFSSTPDYTVAGYGLLRALAQGYRISIYARSTSCFEEIFGKLMNHLLTSSKIDTPIHVTMDCPFAKEALLLSKKRFTLHERYALMLKSVSEKLPLGLSGEPTWGILTEECG